MSSPICFECKKTLPDDAMFCPYCGVSLKSERHQRPRVRPNGAGTAIRRGHTWTARIIIAWKYRDNKPPLAVYRTKGGFASRREALEYCAILRQEKPKKHAPRLADYWDTYSANDMPLLSKSKQVAYKGAWKKLLAIHYRPVDQISISELRNTVTSAANTYYTCRDCKQILTHLFSLAAIDGWCNKDLPSYIVLPKLEEKERRVFSEDEQRALWKSYENGDIRAAIPLLMICTGMMPGEMLALKVENIDLEAHRIIGIGMKTKVRKENPVFIPDDAVPIVEDLIANAQPSGYIFAHVEDKWYRNYYDAIEAAGCRRLEPYCCRHTTATRLAVNENIAPQTIRRMMRWSTTRMLDRYAHPDETDIINAANTFRAPK